MQGRSGRLMERGGGREGGVWCTVTVCGRLLEGEGEEGREGGRRRAWGEGYSCALLFYNASGMEEEDEALKAGGREGWMEGGWEGGRER